MKPWIEDAFLIFKPGYSDLEFERTKEVLTACALTTVSCHSKAFSRDEFDRIFGNRKDADYMTSSDLLILRIRGDNAIFRSRWIKRYIRSVFHCTATQLDNVLHSSDNPHEIALLAEALHVEDIALFADCAMPFPNVPPQDALCRLSWACVFGTVDQAHDLLEWIVECRRQGLPTTIIMGFHLKEAGLIVYPHPVDYEKIRTDRYCYDRVLKDFAMHDAINIALPNGPHEDEPGPRQDGETIVKAALSSYPFINALLCAYPGIDRVRSRNYMEAAHRYGMGISSGSYGKGSVGLHTTSAEQFRSLMAAWRLFF